MPLSDLVWRKIRKMRRSLALHALAGDTGCGVYADIIFTNSDIFFLGGVEGNGAGYEAKVFKNNRGIRVFATTRSERASMRTGLNSRGVRSSVEKKKKKLTYDVYKCTSRQLTVRYNAVDTNIGIRLGIGVSTAL